jgi:hypothetical protein
MFRESQPMPSVVTLLVALLNKEAEGGGLNSSEALVTYLVQVDSWTNQLVAVCVELVPQSDRFRLRPDERSSIETLRAAVFSRVTWVHQLAGGAI